VPPAQDIEGWLRQKNVLYVTQSVDETARHFGTSPQQARGSLERSRQRLLKARALRPRPPLDDKVITGWNGLMISALAKASQTLEEPRYLQAAREAARFLQARLYSPQANRLKRRYRAGSVGIDGDVDDYTQLIQGLLDLYEASFDPGLLRWAVRLQEAQDQLFWDAEKGGYHTVQPTRSKLPIQPRESYDGAEPSPNSIAALNLLRLASITDRDAWQQKASMLFSSFSGTLEKQPEAMPYLAAALDFSQGPQKQIVIAGAPGAADTEALLRLVRRRYLPNRILLLADGAGSQKQLAAWNSVIANMTRLRGKATAYLCEDYVCKLPTSDPNVFARLLNSAMTPSPGPSNP
ncbi:MAG: thioredoxin domain-containing protein, partial [Acidobacteria bacterium]|nr:thioredoxin domain-containing protein [Acidobacteriota bacterium]